MKKSAVHLEYYFVHFILPFVIKEFNYEVIYFTYSNAHCTIVFIQLTLSNQTVRN